MAEETLRRLAAISSVRAVLAVGYYTALIAAICLTVWNGWKVIQENRIYRKMMEETIHESNA